MTYEVKSKAAIQRQIAIAFENEDAVALKKWSDALLDFNRRESERVTQRYVPKRITIGNQAFNSKDPTRPQHIRLRVVAATEAGDTVAEAYWTKALEAANARTAARIREYRLRTTA